VDNQLFVTNPRTSGYSGSQLYAIDPDTGTEHWQFTPDWNSKDPPELGRVLVHAGESLFVAGQPFSYALDLSDGSERWNMSIKGARNQVVSDGTVFISGKELHAADADTGTKRWEYTTKYARGGNHPVEKLYYTTPTVTRGTVFLRGESGILYAVDGVTGVEDWRFTPDESLAKRYELASSPTVAEKTVFFGNSDGYLYAVDADTGTECWRFDTHDAVESSPTVADGVVYVGNDDGNLYAVDADTGAGMWHVKVGPRIMSSPTVVDGTVYVGSMNPVEGGHLYAIGTGHEASSADSRVLLGTLGHHDVRYTTDPLADHTTPATDAAVGDSTSGGGSGREDQDGDCDDASSRRTDTEVYTPSSDSDEERSRKGGDDGGFCPACGAEVSASASYCPSCGSAVVACPSCGGRAPDGTAYCLRCGSVLDRSTRR
jgi:outer membrane protein assembly factor BamB